MRNTVVGFVLVVFATGGLGAGLGDETMSALEHGLDALGIRPAELTYHKQWATDSFFRLQAVDYLLDNPLEVAAYVDSFAEQFLDNRESLVRRTWLQWVETDVELRGRDSTRLRREVEVAARDTVPGTGMLPEPLGRAVNLVIGSFRVGSRYLGQAVAGLSERELDVLVGEGPGFWEEDDTLRPTTCGVLHREFGLDYDTVPEVKAETLLAWTRRLDRRALALAGLAVVSGVQAAERLFDGHSPEMPRHAIGETAGGVDGTILLVVTTRFGRVIVGGAGDNTYHEDCCLIIDPGGDDTYRNRAGGAVGIIDGAFSVVIDCAGDDLYASSRMFSQGAALFGAGVLIDMAGNDVYRAAEFAQGAGLFGTGVLVDRAGQDLYEAATFVQGSGMFGIGQCVDAGGNDSYRCHCYGQGFGSVHGYGLVMDRAGNDCYYAGGEYTHEPLLPHEYRSFAQGFALGWRPDAAGGIGFLCDSAGNDFYNAEVYAQATSYWYSLGMLWDGAGYDHYLAAQYSQGAGIHLAVGGLVDCEGNDSYYSRLGPSQGEGHDLSVGLLLDREGNDVYHASGGQGTALTNSVGLFVDVTGNDVYSSTEALALAGGRPARGFASVGNFLDLAGQDRYTAGSAGADYTSWTNATYGAGTDVGNEPVPGDAEDEGDTLAAWADSAEIPIDTVFKYAAMWEVGNARARVRQARARLEELGQAALEWVYENKVDSKSGLESRAVEKLNKVMPDSAKPFLYRALHDERRRARANAVYWLGKLEDEARDAVDSLFGAMADERASPRWVVRALGDIGDSTVVPRILFLLRDEYEPSRIVTAEACGKLKNPVAIPDLVRTLDDRLFTVRSAAEAALEKIGRPSLEPLLDALPDMESPALGHALRVAGRVAADLDMLDDLELRVRCRQAFLPLLEHERAFVRMQAVEALGHFMDDPLRRELEAAAAGEVNRFVLSAYEKLLSSDQSAHGSGH